MHASCETALVAAAVTVPAVPGQRTVPRYIIIATGDIIGGMIRTQISFEEEQYEALQQRARREGVSMAAFVREAVGDKLQEGREERERIKRRALSMVGMFRGTGENVSEDHDRYLDEAYGAP